MYYSAFGVDFKEEEWDGALSPVCDTRMKCIVFAIDAGLREGGGLGDGLFLDFERVRFD